MVADFFKVLLNGMWGLLNVGIVIDGFEFKFWYFFAFSSIIAMVLSLFGFIAPILGVRERAGRSARYNSKSKGKDGGDRK